MAKQPQEISYLTTADEFEDSLLPSAALLAIDNLTEQDRNALDPLGITPLQDEYTLTLANLEKQIHTASSQLSYEQAELVSACIANHTIKDRLTATGLTRKRYDKLMQDPKVKRTLAIMGAYSLASSGGTRAARKLMLYRMAIENEKSRPNITLQANQLLEDMEKSENAFKMAKEAMSGEGQGGVVFQFDLTGGR